MPTGELWEANHSLFSCIPWIPRHWGLPIFSLLFFVIDVGLIIAMAVLHAFHIDYYTYWNFILITILCAGIAVTYPFEGYVSALFTMIYAPIVFGSTILVNLIILIVIAIDDDIYEDGVDKYGISTIRTGDWIVHGLPLIQCLVLLLFGYQDYFSALLYHWERSEHWTRRWWYWVWFYIAPLCPTILYMLIFDVTQKYTNELSAWAAFGILIGLDIIVMTVYALGLRTWEPRLMTFPDFYPPYLHAPRTKPL